jgi:hypothetical protein
MIVREEAAQLFPDPSVTERLAHAVGLPLTEFVEIFGASWTLAGESGIDFDADPSGSGNLFGPWYLAGQPVQLMLRPSGREVELAVPVARSGYGRVGWMHVWHPAAQWTMLPAGPQLLRTAPAVVADFLKRRRASFRYCRYCRVLTPPEDRLESDVCYGCGSAWRDVVY